MADARELSRNNTAAAPGKKRKRQDRTETHHAQKQDRHLGKKKKKVKTDRVDPGVDNHQQQLHLHVGVDKINSNWKQLQATLMRRRSFTNRNIISKHGQPSKESENRLDAKDHNAVDNPETNVLLPKSADFSLTKALAMDCEMVGTGSDGKRSVLARVSLVNIWGNVIYDKHVRPTEKVTDFRTRISGIRAKHLKQAAEFGVVQKEVAELVAGRILVGHAVRNDLKTMYLSHPKKDIRDTAAYLPLRNKNGRPKALRQIAEEILGVKIQEGEHCSVQDARAAMYIYQQLKHDWELARLKR